MGKRDYADILEAGYGHSVEGLLGSLIVDTSLKRTF